jgi:hypothetical protein
MIVEICTRIGKHSPGTYVCICGNLIALCIWVIVTIISTGILVPIGYLCIAVELFMLIRHIEYFMVLYAIVKQIMILEDILRRRT